MRATEELTLAFERAGADAIELVAPTTPEERIARGVRRAAGQVGEPGPAPADRREPPGQAREDRACLPRIVL